MAVKPKKEEKPHVDPLKLLEEAESLAGTQVCSKPAKALPAQHTSWDC